MPCYILACGDSPFVKLGWTDRTIKQRIRHLQTSHHEELRVLRVIEGTRAIEKWMHRYFKQHHVRNEWFRLVPEMLTIEPPSIPEKAKRKPRAALVSWAADACTLQKPCADCQKHPWAWLGANNLRALQRSDPGAGVR